MSDHSIHTDDEVDMSKAPDITVEPRLVTVFSPITDESVKVKEDIYKRLRQEERSRFKNYASQLLNYVSVLTSIISKIIKVFPMAVFYMVLFSIMASDLNAQDHIVLMENIIPFLPYLLNFCLSMTMLAVMGDFFINGKKYGLRSVIQQALFERAKNNVTFNKAS